MTFWHYAVAALTVVMLAQGWLLDRETKARAVAEAKVEQLQVDLKAANKAAVSRAKAEAKAKPAAEKKARDLGAAVAKAPEWANQSVPKEVQDALAQ